MYHKVAVNCFRYFDFTSFEQVDRLTPAQYNVMMEALELKMLDANFEAHRQAYLNFAVQAQKSSGKKMIPVFRNFRKFFDYEKELKNVTRNKKKGGDPRFANLSRAMKRGEKESGRIL